MKKRIPLLLMLSLAALLLLSGCVDLVQEVTVREDGSGALRLALGVEAEAYDLFHEQVPEGYELENLISTLMLDENVVEVVQDHYEVDGSIWDSVELEIGDMAAMFAEDRSFGPVMLALDESEGVYSFEEEIDVANSTLTIPGLHLMDLTEASFTVRLNTPQILETTGIHEAAGVSTWEVGLTELLEEDDRITLTADYVLAPYVGTFIPWDVLFPYVVAGFLGAGALAILIVVVVNTRKKGEQEQRLKF